MFARPSSLYCLFTIAFNHQSTVAHAPTFTCQHVAQCVVIDPHEKKEIAHPHVRLSIISKYCYFDHSLQFNHQSLIGDQDVPDTTATTFRNRGLRGWSQRQQRHHHQPSCEITHIPKNILVIEKSFLSVVMKLPHRNSVDMWTI